MLQSGGNWSSFRLKYLSSSQFVPFLGILLTVCNAVLVSVTTLILKVHQEKLSLLQAKKGGNRTEKIVVLEVLTLLPVKGRREVSAYSASPNS